MHIPAIVCVRRSTSIPITQTLRSIQQRQCLSRTEAVETRSKGSVLAHEGSENTSQRAVSYVCRPAKTTVRW